MQTQIQGKYTMQGLFHSINIFKHPEDCTKSPKLRTLALRYLFQYRDKERLTPSRRELLEGCEKMFQEYLACKNLSALRELADIYFTFSTKNKRLLLDRLENIEDETELQELKRVTTFNSPELKTKKLNVKTVYTDSQNVHNSKINKSVLNAADNLCDMYSEILNINQADVLQNIKDEMIKLYPDKVKLIKDIIVYFSESTFLVQGEKQQITFPKVFIAVWLFLCEHKNKKELEGRLLEEMQEMHGYCTTGHLARLISVIQGYTENISCGKELEIRISELDQCKSVIKNYLSKRLAECQDEKVIEGMISEEEEKTFIKFIRICVAEKLLEWKETYGNQDNPEKILEYISIIVNDFCGKKVFK